MTNNREMTPQRFLEVFGPSLVDYLGQTYGKEGAYVLDLLPQAAEFFSVSYHAVSALEYADYTSSKVDVAEEEVK
jgi:hypothetical protein